MSQHPPWIILTILLGCGNSPTNLPSTASVQSQQSGAAYTEQVLGSSQTELPQGSPQLPACCRSASLESSGTQTNWIPVAERIVIDSLHFDCQNIDEESRPLGEWINGPTLLMFFYTRCENPRMCGSTTSLFQQLQADATLPAKTRLLLLTYEPQRDTSRELKRYAIARNIDLNNDRLQLLRVESDALPNLLAELNVPVAYSTGTVGVHDHAGYLFDQQGRVVRIYLGLLPDIGVIQRDLKRLATESESSGSSTQ